jgi:subtilisin family serine protease
MNLGVRFLIVNCPRQLRLLLGLPLVLGFASCSRTMLPLPGDNSKAVSALAPYSMTPAQSTSSGPAHVLARIVAGTSAAELAASYQAEALGEISELRIVLLRTPNGVSTSAFVTRLSADPRVEFSEPDFPVDATETRQSSIAFSEGLRSWNDVADQGALRRIGAADAHRVTNGEGVLVAILDTGIELDHPALVGALALPGIEPGVATDPGDDRAEGVDTNGDGLVDGALGHGTHVAGIVHAVAPAARLLPVRVLDSDGVGDAFALARGLVACTKAGAAVANLSLGMSQPSQSVRVAIEYAGTNGVLIAAPAGNVAAPTVDFPASEAQVVAVAATDSLDRRAAFSNYGAEVDVSAPGVGILSTYVGGGYALWSGTSMSTPFASGICALLYSMLGERNPHTETNVGSDLGAGAQPLAATDPDYAPVLGAGRVSASGSIAIVLQAREPSAETDPLTVRPAP